VALTWILVNVLGIQLFIMLSAEINKSAWNIF